MAATKSDRARETAAVPPPAATADESLILLERRGPVVILRLNHPPLNILTTPLLDEMREKVVELSHDPRVRAVVVTGSGEKAFSGGADVREMLSMSRAASARHSAKGQTLYNLLERAPFPVIAAVRGYCVGGGCEMVQACDFVIASDDAFFGQPEINIGVIPGWGGSQRLPRTIGPVRARRWIMTGDRVGAAQALQDGLVDRVVPPADLVEAAVDLGRTLASKPAEALAAAKYLINHATDPGRLKGLEYERELWGRLFETPGQQEGMRAFLEKRPAIFPAERRSPGKAPSFPWERSNHAEPGARPRKTARKGRPGQPSRARRGRSRGRAQRAGKR